MIIEMRTYTTKPGCRERFLEVFREKTVPAHVEIGMKLLGRFLSVEHPDTFFCMRGFPDLASREPMKTSGFAPAVEYSWKSTIGVIVGTRVIPGGHSTAMTITPTVAINFVH
jgi:hypothetical protein